jgi:Zn-dependent protease/CBS domain-containing protein
MFGKKIPLFKLFGFQINIDYSWFFVLILITWSLAAGEFPRRFEGLAPSTYWTMGLTGALLLFVSIVLHELGHSVVARGFGIEMKGITLFIFGGVAEMTEEPKSPKAEFWIAIAGPIVSVLLAFGAAAMYYLGTNASWPVPVLGVAGYLAFVNTAVVVFNLLPAFPLDGGRVLRSILWRAKNSLKWATRITSQIGSGFGFMFIALGILSLLSGNFIGGLWWALIGLFLRGAAGMSYQQLITRRMLEGEPIARFMTRDPIVVPANATVQQLVEDFVYTHHHKFYPVLDGERLVGCVTLDDVKHAPRERWHETAVGELVHGCSDANTISAQADAMDALTLMSREKSSRLMVTEDDRLLGIVALKDLLDFLAVKVELEEA